MVHSEEAGQRVNMSKDSREHRCHACDIIFKAEPDLDRHMKDKHTEAECHMCNKKFTSGKQLQDHICMEGDIIPQVCQKSYCKKEYVSSEALAKHMKTSHFGSQRSVCQKCGEIIDLNEGTKKHMEKCSSGKSNRVGENIREKSKEVCKHWRRCRCNRGIQCNFSHVGRQDSISPNNQATQKQLKIAATAHRVRS